MKKANEVKKCCAWCEAEMSTLRSSKKLCSQKCHNQFHYWRQKNYPGMGVVYGFEMLDQLKRSKESETE